MPTGTVKWFNNAKGFGFILPDSGGDDIFAHYSAIEMEGYRTLKAGQSVTFDVAQGDKGLHATHIQVSGSQQTTAAKPDTTPASVVDEDSDTESAENFAASAAESAH